MNFLMVIMASGIARGSVRTTTTTTTTESRKMAAILQVIKTITKFSNVIAHVMLVIGQYAPFCARCFGELCRVNCWVFQHS